MLDRFRIFFLGYKINIMFPEFFVKMELTEYSTLKESSKMINSTLSELKK